MYFASLFLYELYLRLMKIISKERQFDIRIPCYP